MQNISKERKRDRERKKPISKKNLFPHYIILYMIEITH